MKSYGIFLNISNFWTFLDYVSVEKYLCIGYNMPYLCYSWIYKLVLNISCQHLGDECNLEGFLVPFGHRVGGMYIFGIYVSWLNICLYWLYHANTWEMNVIWRVSLCHSGTRLWECTFLEYVSVKYITL